MEFAIEPLETCWAEIYEPPHGLAYQHWCETQGFRHYQGYAPSFERYNSYAKTGLFLQFTVRDKSKLVGYAGVYVVPSQHSQQIITVEDTWYLTPSYRKGWNAIRFYRFMEDECKKRGAVESTLTLPAEKDLDPIVQRLGYTCTAKQYTKNLVRADSPSNGEILDVQSKSAASS